MKPRKRAATSQIKFRGIYYVLSALVLLPLVLLFASQWWSHAQDYRRLRHEGQIIAGIVVGKEETGDGLFVNYDYGVNDSVFRVTEGVTKDLYNSLTVQQSVELYYLPDVKKIEKTLLVGNSTDNRHHNRLFFTLFGGTLLLGMLAGALSRQPVRLGRFFHNLKCLFWIGCLFSLVGLYMAPSPADLDFIVLGLITLLVAAYAVFTIVLLFPIWRSARKRNCKVTGETPQIPIQWLGVLHDAPAQLEQLGFSPLGGLFATCEGTDGGAALGIFHNADFTILAEVIDAPPMVQFRSWLGEKTCLETSFPMGENTRTATYFCEFTEESIVAAFDLHEIKLRELQPHLAPLHAVTTLQAARQWDEKYYEWGYHHQRTRRLANVLLLRMLAVIFFTLLAFSSIFAHASFSPSTVKIFLLVGTLLTFLAYRIPEWLHNFRRTPQDAFIMVEADPPPTDDKLKDDQ